MTCYAVLWIPTIVYRDLKEVVTTTTKETNISDDQGNSLNVRVCLLENESVNIDIYSDAESDYEHYITLKFIKPSCNGLRLYSYEYTANPQYKDGFQFTDKIFPEAIYHIIKEFYHKHDFHESANDASLIAFTSREEVNIQDDDNPALAHYLQRYEFVLRSIVDSIHEWLESIRAKSDIKDAIFKAFPKLCLKARGYEVYMDTLYHSRYNKKCRVNCYDNRKLRQRAFNIENAQRYIKAAEYEYSIKYQHNSSTTLQAIAERNIQLVQETAQRNITATQETAEQNIKEVRKSAKSSTLLALVSIVLGIISIIYSECTSYKSSKDLLELRIKLETTIVNVSATVEEIRNQQNAIQELLPELNDVESQNEKLIHIERTLKILQTTIDKKYCSPLAPVSTDEKQELLNKE